MVIRSYSDIENSLERLFAGEDPVIVFPPKANTCASCSKFVLT